MIVSFKSVCVSLKNIIKKRRFAGLSYPDATTVCSWIVDLPLKDFKLFKSEHIFMCKVYFQTFYKKRFSVFFSFDCRQLSRYLKCFAKRRMPASHEIAKCVPNLTKIDCLP